MGSNHRYQQLTCLLRLLRVKQWVKNVFVFIPLFFSGSLLQPSSQAAAIVAFVCFCMASSAVYMVNDVVDRKQDRLHPRKKLRPLACRQVSVKTALALAAVSALGALTLGMRIDFFLSLLILTYMLNGCLYTFYLKHVVILDFFSISAGFALRIIAGATAIDAVISTWLLIGAVNLSLFLALGKRRYEIRALGAEAVKHRPVLASYSNIFLDVMLGVAAGSTLISYLLYCKDMDTIARFGQELFLTVPLVFYGVFRYIYLLYESDQDGDPTETLWRDRPLQISVLLWVLLFLVLFLGSGPSSV